MFHVFLFLLPLLLFFFFLPVDWVAPVQGEQWGLHFHREIEVLRGE
jgi:hypothetical protein